MMYLDDTDELFEDDELVDGSKFWYAIRCLMGTILFYWVSKYWLPMNLSIPIWNITLSQKDSVIAYMVVFVVCLGISIFLFHHENEPGSGFFVVVLPSQIFLLLYLMTKYRIFCGVACCVISFFTVICCLDMHEKMRRAHAKSRRFHYLKELRKDFCALCIIISAFLFLTYIGYAICVAILGITSLLPIGNKPTQTQSQTTPIAMEVYTQEELWDRNQDNLILFMTKNYNRLSADEKLDVLQNFIDMQMEYFGCEKVQLIHENISQRGIAGYYNNVNRVICIDTETYQTAGTYEILNILYHECFHVYEETLVEAYDEANANGEDTSLRFTKEIAQWKIDLENYQAFDTAKTKEEQEKYRNQLLERSANEYSEAWALQCFRYIYGMESE